MNTMKHLKLFLFTLGILGISTSGASAQDIYGNYTGTVDVNISLFGISESLDEVIVELSTDGSDNYLKFEDFDFGGFEVPILNNVVITPNGNGYNITRPGEITFVIPELTLPPFPPLFPGGTFYNVPVVITLESGSIVNNEMTLNVKLVATVDVVIPPLPPIPFSIPVDIKFVGILSLQEFEYDPLAVARINAMIDNNGLKAEKDKPETWEFAGWNDENPRQLLDLDVDNKSLLGSLYLAGLANLQFLECMNNYLTEIILTGCTHLEELYCAVNNLTAIDLTGLNALTDFSGGAQTVTLTLDNDGCGTYTYAIPLNNPTFSEPSIIRYEDGVLKSTDHTITATGFSVETGNSKFELSGVMNFIYTGVGIGVGALHALPILVYPNPTSGILNLIQETINNEQLTIENIEVLDVFGRKLISITLNRTEQTKIDISYLPADVYFLRIVTEKGSMMQKVIKN
jgi:hypothetical protein